VAKAKAKKLKVYRTPIGFHDAYVAAPSQKAALEAWGSSGNLFTQGAAEIVTDPKLIGEALARPGEVVRKLRGSEAEQIRAVGKLKTTKAETTAKAPPKGRKPSRAGVDKAEKAVEAAEARHRAASAKLEAEADALERRRRELEAKQRRDRERLEQAAEQARARYRKAMDEWAG
jgi:hypothetical protein